MKTRTKWKLLFVGVVLIIVLAMCVGCQQVIISKEPAQLEQGETEQVYFVNIQLNSFLMHFNFDELHYKDWLFLKDYAAEAQEVTAITPGVAITTEQGD